MLDQALELTLTSLGLSEHEAKVYLAAVSLGPATVMKIAAAAEIKRTTVYSVVESLKQKGLMTIVVKGFKNLFAAENPEKLESILETRKNLLTQTLPELSALYNLKGGESTIKYYEGITGIKSVYEGLIRDIKPKEDYMVTSHIEQWLKLAPDFFIDFTKRRAKLNINIRLLMQDSPIARAHQKIQHTLNETIKILPRGTSLDTNVIVIPRRVVIHQLVAPITAIVIENPSVVKMHQQLFEIIWRSLP